MTNTISIKFVAKTLLIVFILCVLVQYSGITTIVISALSCVRAQEESGVGHCVNGTRFIVGPLARNCSRMTPFDPYTIHGSDVQRMIHYSLPGSPHKQCINMKFSTDLKMPRTALASHPGSGNTWTRHLIQQLTGIYVGSRYRDLMVYMADKPRVTRVIQFKEWAELVWNGSCIAIKTHELGHGPYGEYNPHQYDKAIVIIRNPHDSLKAEYKRRYLDLQQHPKNITEDIFSPNGSFRTFFKSAAKDCGLL